MVELNFLWNTILILLFIHFLSFLSFYKLSNIYQKTWQGIFNTLWNRYIGTHLSFPLWVKNWETQLNVLVFLHYFQIVMDNIFISLCTTTIILTQEHMWAEQLQLCAPFTPLTVNLLMKTSPVKMRGIFLTVDLNDNFAMQPGIFPIFIWKLLMSRTENSQVCKCLFIPCFMQQVTVSEGAAYSAGIWCMKMPWAGLWWRLCCQLWAAFLTGLQEFSLCTCSTQYLQQPLKPCIVSAVISQDTDTRESWGVSLEVTGQVETELGDWTGKPSGPGVKRRKVRKNVTSGGTSLWRKS